MRSLKRFTYSVIGITVFVVLPAFFIISKHLEKNFPGNDFVVKHVSGNATVQYQVNHRVDPASDRDVRYQKKSRWIPLIKAMNVGSGALIKIDKNSSIDIIRNNKIALRVKEDSIFQLKHIKGAGDHAEATLRSGKIICRVKSDTGKKRNNGTEPLKVITPQATALVRGTTFSVAYQPDKNTSQVEVLKGLVAVKSEKFANMEFKVPDGKMLTFRSQQAPVFEMLNPAVLKELRDTQDLKLTPTIYDRWDETLRYVSGLPLYKKALIEITKYELKVFIRSIKYLSPLRWNHRVPDSIRAVELEEGDYKDPWDTDYLYEKLGAQKAALISAGPDKTYHTNDDIFMGITIKN
jgi:hypothetical protein